MRKITAAWTLFSFFIIQGCVATLASGAGYLEAKAKYSKLYSAYNLEMEEVNSERKANGLASETVKEFNEWIKEQPLSYSEIKVFKIYGVISPEEAKRLRRKKIESGPS